MTTEIPSVLGRLRFKYPTAHAYMCVDHRVAHTPMTVVLHFPTIQNIVPEVSDAIHATVGSEYPLEVFGTAAHTNYSSRERCTIKPSKSLTVQHEDASTIFSANLCRAAERARYELRKKHSNIRHIAPYFRCHSNKYIDYSEHTITVAVGHKGLVPQGEALLPTQFEGFPIDVVEQFNYFPTAQDDDAEQDDDGECLILGEARQSRRCCKLL